MNAMHGEYRDVDVKSVFNTETGGFHGWFESGEGIAQLSRLTGMNLQFGMRESNAGRFKVDLALKTHCGEKAVIVEAQLDRGNHDHLGKLMVYANEKQAEAALWISTGFADEHLCLIDELNACNFAGCRFYAFAIQVGVIGDSKPAPMLIPVRWPKRSLRPHGSVKQTPMKLHPDHQACVDAMKQKLAGLVIDHPDNWKFAGKTGRYWHKLFFRLSSSSHYRMFAQCKVNKRKLSVGAEIRGNWAGEKYDRMLAHRAEIEKALGLKLFFDSPFVWHEMAIPKAKQAHDEKLIDQAIDNLSSINKHLDTFFANDGFADG